MFPRPFYWLLSGGIAISIHIAVFIGMISNGEVKTEKSSGEGINVIGAAQFGKVQELLKPRIEKKETKIEEKKQLKPKEQPVVKKKTIKPKELAKPKVEKAELTQKEPVQEKKKVQEKPRQDIIKKKVEKKTEPEKTKKKEKKKKKKSRAANTKTAAAKIGKGQKGRQNKVSGRASLTNYLGKINAHIGRYKYYSEDLRRKRVTGKVVIRFSIARSGRVLRARVVKSSGSKALDKIALNAIKRASPFPPVPNGVRLNEPFSVPMFYSLR